DEIDHSEKLCVQEDIVHGKSEKRDYQIKYAMYRVLGEDGHQRKKNRQKGYEIKNAHAAFVKVISGLGRGFMFFLIIKPGFYQFVLTIDKILTEIVCRYMGPVQVNGLFWAGLLTKPTKYAAEHVDFIHG